MTLAVSTRFRLGGAEVDPRCGLAVVSIAVALGLSLFARSHIKSADLHEFVNAIKELGVFCAVIIEAPLGSDRRR